MRPRCSSSRAASRYGRSYSIRIGSASAQRLAKAGLKMEEFPQSVPNLTEASTHLYELIKGCSLVAYPDAVLRLAVSRAVAVEG